MDQGRQGRDQVDTAVVQDVRGFEAVLSRKPRRQSGSHPGNPGSIQLRIRVERSVNIVSPAAWQTGRGVERRPSSLYRSALPNAPCRRDTWDSTNSTNIVTIEEHCTPGWIHFAGTAWLSSWPMGRMIRGTSSNIIARLTRVTIACSERASRPKARSWIIFRTTCLFWKITLSKWFLCFSSQVVRRVDCRS